MSAIHILKPQVANQIAAGEVVDGSGIEKSDCRNAFLRHATSKIATSDDLSRITTLGFRGEALASIASVARVSMTTRVSNADCGTHLIIENGTVIKEEDVSCVFGTTFVVEELFACVPARLKFLKSYRTEAGYIGDYIGKMILARPDISFRYENDGKTVYETYGDGELFNALFCIYGKTVSDKLVPIDYDNGYMKINGYLGLPEIARNNRSFQTLFVNGRAIRSISVSAAVAQAYDTRLMIGRFPFFVLNLHLAPQEVDVNVHPTKSEVRFADDNRVFTTVSAACKLALAPSQQYIESALDHVAPKPATASIQEQTMQRSPLDNERPRIDFHSVASGNHPDYSYRENAYSSFQSTGSVGSVKSFQLKSDKTVPESKPIFQSDPLFQHEPITVLGCAFQTYWIVAQGDQLYFIDQHAAHERKLYNELTDRRIEMSSQQLLVPREVVLTPSEIECWQENQNTLIKLGFGLTRSGALNLIMSAIPVLNGQMLSEAYLHNVLSILSSREKNLTDALLRERTMQAACKHAVKGGDPIEEAEIRSLLDFFLNGEVPLTCPHGRPVVVRITKTELEKMFRRIV